MAKIGKAGSDGGADQRDFVLVAAGLRGVKRFVRRLAVERRIDVSAAGEQQAVNACDDIRRLVALVVELDRLAADAPD